MMSSIDLQQPPEFRHESTTINQLPNETLLSIFQLLNITDRIRSRVVCKRFKLLCDEVRVSAVIISNQIANIRGRWFHTNRPFDHKDAIALSTFNAVRSTFQLEKFVKRLYFDGNPSQYKQLKLNNFTQLEEVKIELMIRAAVDLFSAEIDIRLPNLKILHIDVDDDDDPRHLKLVLATPKLEAFRCHDCIPASVAHVDAIKHLEINVPGGMTDSLRNLRYLQFDMNVPRDFDILSKYPKLETFLCNEFNAYRHESSEAMVRHFLKQKRILRRRKLRIFYQSVEMVRDDKIDELNSAKSLLAFQMNNYDTLSDYVCIDDLVPLDYNELMELVKDRGLPDDFFVKFGAIPEVKVSGKVNREQLLHFLKNMENFDELYLNDAILDQEFFDGLAEISKLTNLHMKNSSTLVVSYKFLRRLKKLEVFDTDDDSLEFFDLSVDLFKELKYFRKMEFFDGKELIKLRIKLGFYEFRRFALHQGQRGRLLNKKSYPSI